MQNKKQYKSSIKLATYFGYYFIKNNNSFYVSSNMHGIKVTSTFKVGPNNEIIMIDKTPFDEEASVSFVIIEMSMGYFFIAIT